MTKIKQTDTTETGKSMVEMLGTLAIMGLLAVLGAKGYDMAMIKVNANTLINEVNRRSVIYSQQMNTTTLSTPLNSTEMAADLAGGYHVTAARYGTLYFKIDIDNIGQEVCEQIGKQGMASALQINANGTVITSDDTSGCIKAPNTLSFVFNKELTPCEGCLDTVKTCTGDGSCPGGYICENGVCMCDVPCQNKCCTSPLQNICVNGSCVECATDSDCAENPQFGYDYVCQMNMCVPAEIMTGCDACNPATEFCQYQTVIDECSRSGVTDPVCKPKGTLSPVTAHNGETYYISSANVNWWNAKNLCASFGKHLVTLDEACTENSGSCANFAGLVGSCSLTWLNTEADSCSSYGLAGNGANPPWIATDGCGWTRKRKGNGKALCK